MTKISSYPLDQDVVGDDKWIGSDIQNQNRTKNFTPDKLASYFNDNQIVNIGMPIQYKYYTLDPLEPRSIGTLTFETEIGASVPFSTITTFLLSKYTTKQNDVSQYLDFLNHSKVLLYKSNDINQFGFYKILTLEPYITDPTFFVLTVEFIDGNGSMLEDKDYMISLVGFDQGVVPIKGTQYSYVAGNGTPTENGIELQTAYNLAKTIVGLSATNRFKIIVGTGKYTVTGQFAIDTQYIDFVSLTGDADVEFTNGIYVTANNVFLKGLKTNAQFELATNLSLLVCDTCIGGYGSFGFQSNTVSGTFTNCIGGSYSFGGNSSIASGTFLNCIGGDNSFGGYLSIASGTFSNCIGGYYSFGSSTASGTFSNCIGRDYSFGGYAGTASGTFTNCIGGNLSFGGNIGVLSGKLFYCRLIAGTFKTVSSGGRTYYCVDGNGDTNNQ